ncbi:MAG: type II toxin-antitoxin system RelE/ParE family toxin [Candidatus Margulisbacteria bacterium]|jgi:plasmid stabilization system protein ParE|nr:type II toxin-antitoxin system RelE/ParE family toxin [Candidatus Margulisiibacteriota bacterium]
MTKLQIAPLVRQDLREIHRYIAAELASPDAAQRALAKILSRIAKLARYPKIGAALNSIIIPKTDYRFLPCENYLIFYRCENKIVYVDRVLYGRRDFVKILFKEIST